MPTSPDQPWPRQGLVLRRHAAIRNPQRGRLRDRGNSGGCLLDLVGGDIHSTALITFLASDRTANITGVNYLIDGGLIKTT